MTAYFDIENLESFLSSPKDKFFQNCLNLIQEELDLVFNFSKDELKKSELLMLIPKLLAEGRGDNTHIFAPEKFPARTIKSNTHKDFDVHQLTSAFFIKDDNLAKLKDRSDILIADVGEEIELFTKLFLQNTKYFFEDVKTIEKFGSWSYLKKHNVPYTDLIIVDNFLFKNEDNIEANLFPMLENFIGCTYRKKINIVIFVKQGEINLDLLEIQRKMKAAVAKFHEEEPNITIIQSFMVHDRFILNNCFLINSGPTFNAYFYPTGKPMSKPDIISFRSIANKNYYDLYFQLLSKYQKILDNVDKQYIIGDKVSRFLNFP
ncbi:hypothetical protein CO230_03845 [Chryseobacterium sp. 6424]|uniref:hypothetical protein n=1 Tax=Chryseobacterium sp. 6424 TaxID=2039166 RepID=UPI000EFA3696|nr:hypothetical protein [Chryseobacterium sp. 6424]AYO57330.1 hypothetical protein CO230_03845 [Chryseobacterium sp. 6424]